MSIIYEALKKVEREKQPQESLPKEERAGQVKKELAKKRKRRGKTRLWIIGVSSVVLTCGFGIFWQQFQEKDLKSLKSVRPISKKSAFKTASPGSYILEGIVYDEESAVAIINGQSLKEQDLIGEFKLADITSDSVKLINIKDNTTLILSLEF